MTLERGRWRRSAAADGIVSVTEGGYDLQALAASLDAVIEAHATPVPRAVAGPTSAPTVERGSGCRSRRYAWRRAYGSSKSGSC